MSTICKICIRSNEEPVAKAISEYLKSKNIEFLEKSSEWPMAHDGKTFQINEEFPSILSYKAISPEVVEVHFNSLAKPKGLADHLSKSTESPVVINLYQSNADASYWSYHHHGDCAREVESGDGEIYYQYGAPLGFERDPLGHNISDPHEEPFFIFNHEDQDFYNKSVGIEAKVYQDYESNWGNFIVTAGTRTKARWRFW